MSIRIPKLESLSKYAIPLAHMVAETSWLPHPDAVRAFDSAVFPTLRRRKDHPVFSEISDNDEVVGMYDDNTTPMWALLWSHDIVGGTRKGWGFAHVWPETDDIKYYTHLANLVMLPECFMSLTDKAGPLTDYLRWHAWTVYRWKPEHLEQPHVMPEDFENIKWNYFQNAGDPKAIIRERFEKLDNERVRILRPILEKQFTAK